MDLFTVGQLVIYTDGTIKRRATFQSYCEGDEALVTHRGRERDACWVRWVPDDDPSNDLVGHVPLACLKAA